MADERDGENVIHIIGGDVADNLGGKLKSETGYEDQEASVDAAFNLINAARGNEEIHIQPIGSSGSVMETERSRGRYCKYFHSEAGCPFGDQCTHMHDEEKKNREMTAIVVPTRSQVLHREGGVAPPPLAPPRLAPLPTRPLAPPAARPSVAALLEARAASNLPVKRLSWRTKICSRWEQEGHCSYGSRCIFAHGEAELQRYGGGPVAKGANPNNQDFQVPSNAAASGSSVARVVAAPVASDVAVPGSSVACDIAAPGSSVTHAGGSGQPSGAARRPWRGPNKISRIYGDWID